jgi:hypothetical protein
MVDAPVCEVVDNTSTLAHFDAVGVGASIPLLTLYFVGLQAKKTKDRHY